MDSQDIELQQAMGKVLAANLASAYGSQQVVAQWCGRPSSGVSEFTRTSFWRKSEKLR
jgi:hypothetical protein